MNKTYQILLRNLAFICIIISFANSTNAQTAFEKAKDLKKIDQDDKYKKVVLAINQWKKVPKWFSKLKGSEKRIILHTANFFDTPFSKEVNINLVKPAEFIKIVDTAVPDTNFVEDLSLSALRGEVSEYDFSTSSETIGASTGLASPSAVIDGAARFLVNRTKQELEIAFFDEFRKRIERDTLLPFLLPETYRMLRYQDYFQVPSLGKTWTTAFEKDLNDVPLNMDLFLRAKCKPYFDTTALFVFSLGVNTFKQVKEGAKIPTLLDRLTEDFAFIDARANQTNRKIYNSFKFLNIISSELVTTKEGDANFKWIERTAFKELGTWGQRYFWLLVYRMNQDFFDKNVGKMTKVNQFDGTYRVIGELLDVFTKLNGAISFPILDDSPSAAAIVATEQIIKGVELFARLDTIFNPSNKANKEFIYGKFLPLAASSLSIMNHAQSKEYGAMSLQIVRTLEAALTPIYGQKAPNTLKTIFFYMNFMVDVITADNGVKIERIIERYALPPQSYRMKRHTPFSITLNSFSGIGGGFENVLDAKGANQKAWGAIGGVTAPIGPSLNWGKIGKLEESSLSLFIPVIDIGAAFAYRWSESATGFPADLRWSQVFSPGAYLIWGLPRMPISFAIGGQMTPKLRDITNNGVKLQSNAVRFGINASIDIPFFKLY